MLPVLRSVVRMAPPKGAPNCISPTDAHVPAKSMSSPLDCDDLQGVLPRLHARPNADGGNSTKTVTKSVARARFLPEALTLPSLGESRVKKPCTPRTEAKRERRKRTKEGLTEVQRSLRCLRGEWDAQLFCDYRHRFSEEGRWEIVSGLRRLAAEASEKACLAYEYKTSPLGADVGHLPRTHRTHWMGFENLPPPFADKEVMAPPMIFSDRHPLDVLETLRRNSPSHSIIMSFDATDFTRDGMNLASASDAASASQQDMLMRTNLESFQQNAMIFCQRHGLESHLAAESNPYVLAGRDVVVFRGKAEDGYPFLSDSDQLRMNVVMTARSTKRVAMAKGELFGTKQHQDSWNGRLHLLALAAISIALEEEGENMKFRPQGTQPTQPVNLPILVISMQDLVLSSNPQPRHGIANLLKDWRLLYADSFETVVVACGDRDTASLFDKCVNSPIYAAALLDPNKTPVWHWQEQVLALSVNQVLRRIRGQRPQCQSRRDSPSPTARSRASFIMRQRGAGLAFGGCQKSMIADALRTMSGTELAKQGRPSSDCSSRSDHDDSSSQKSFVSARTTRSSLLLSPVCSKPSPVADMNSKERFERFLKNRLDDSKPTDSYSLFKEHASQSNKSYHQNPETEQEAAGGMARARAANLVHGMGQDSRHKLDKAARDKKKWFDSQAELFELPEDLKAELSACLETQPDECNAAEAEQEKTESATAVKDLREFAAHMGNDLQKRRSTLRVAENTVVSERRASRCKMAQDKLYAKRSSLADHLVQASSN